MSGYYPIELEVPKGWEETPITDKVRSAIPLGTEKLPYYEGYYQAIYRDREDQTVWYLIVAYCTEQAKACEQSSYRVYTLRSSQGPSFPVPGWPKIPARSLWRWALLGAGIALAAIGVSVVAKSGKKTKTKGKR